MWAASGLHGAPSCQACSRVGDDQSDTILKAPPAGTWENEQHRLRHLESTTCVLRMSHDCLLVSFTASGSSPWHQAQRPASSCAMRRMLPVWLCRRRMALRQRWRGMKEVRAEWGGDGAFQAIQGGSSGPVALRDVNTVTVLQ
jgi:hypothetical protein